MHKEEACQRSKGGGEIKKRAFKLSPLGPVSVIADGVLSIQPTVLVSMASPPQLVNTHSLTHSLTHTDSFRCFKGSKENRSRKNCSGTCKSVAVVSVV